MAAVLPHRGGSTAATQLLVELTNRSLTKHVPPWLRNPHPRYGSRALQRQLELQFTTKASVWKAPAARLGCWRFTTTGWWPYWLSRNLRTGLPERKRPLGLKLGAERSTLRLASSHCIHDNVHTVLTPCRYVLLRGKRVPVSGTSRMTGGPGSGRRCEYRGGELRNSGKR